jgi:hypothetical protein
VLPRRIDPVGGALPAGRPPAAVRAAASIRIGDRVELSAEASATRTGLLAVGVLVSSILLSTAVIVAVAAQRRALPASDGEPAA